MKRITPADRIDELLMAGTLDESRALLDRAAQIVRIREKLAGVEKPKRTRKVKLVEQPPPIAVNR